MKSIDRPTWLVIGAVVLLAILYFGFSNVSDERQSIDKKRSLVSESVSINTLLKNAKDQLRDDVLESIEAFEIQLEKTTDEVKRIELMKELAGRWYRLSEPAISGYYAEKIAEKLENDPDAWSIAGTTFTLCLQKDGDSKTKDFCSKRARVAFENAISLEPEVVSHRVNMAVAQVEYPSGDNPMQGILMLRDLADQYPDNATVHYQLGRFAIQTGQFEKAIERLNTALELQPDSALIACLLGQAYQGAGKTREAEPFLSKCN